MRRVRTASTTGPDETEHRLIPGEARGARTDFLHHPGEIVTEDDWKLRRALQPEQAPTVAGGALHVDRIHGRRIDADKDLPRPGTRHCGAAHGELGALRPCVAGQLASQVVEVGTGVVHDRLSFE